MARNNGDRLGVPATQTLPNPELGETPPNPMLAFATPTTFVDLPSKGTLYPEGHPLSGCEQIEIRFMTAKEEDILTSQALLKKGIAIDRMLQSVIVDGRIKVAELAVGDKNALIIAARVSGYGKDYEVGVNCPSCGAQVEYSFDLEKVTINDGGDTGGYDIVKTDSGTFVIKTPMLEAEVEMRPMYGVDERYLTDLASNKKRKKLPEAALTDQLKRLIVSVNGSKDMHMRDSFISNAPAIDTRYLRKAYNQVTPNIDLTQEFNCSSCGEQTEMAVPLTAKFFWS
mgnify:FL=1|tara:strand:+ start:1664 stop:2515 length:852 start_codon:yes stop_codon:yes gene_type:complete